jgi:glycosyltransferase involved in cell wall biosynthesis
MEAAACGTPVIAFRRGALPEVVAEGITGMLANDQSEMVSALARLRTIEPEQCLSYAQENYSAERMAECYCGIYRGLLG